jgi:hypothetical protein
MNNEYNVGNQEINFLNNIYIKLDYIIVININIMFFISFIIIIIMIITTLIPTNKYWFKYEKKKIPMKSVIIKLNSTNYIFF